jgi:hypothetical protein
MSEASIPLKLKAHSRLKEVINVMAAYDKIHLHRPEAGNQDGSVTGHW